MAAIRFLLVAALLYAGTAAVATSRPAAPIAQPFTVRDLVRLERLSDVAVSPDGTWVAYTVRTTDMEANKGRTSVWLLEVGRGRSKPHVAKCLSDAAANAGAAEWSADGSFIYFLSDRGGSNQVWRASANGNSDSLQVTNLPLDVASFRISPKGDRILVSMEVFLDCADLACTKQRLTASAHAQATGVVYEQLFVRHWDAWADGRRSQVFSMALDNVARGDPVNVTAGLGDVPGKPFGGHEDYAFSPDGAQVAFAVRLPAGEAWSTNFDIYLTSVAGGAPRNLTADNPAWDGQPAFSPDGTQLAYVAMERPGFEADRFHLVLLDLKSGTKRQLTQKWDRTIEHFAWSRDGKTLFATTPHLGQHPLWSIDAGTGRTSAITGAGDVEGFSVAPGRIFYSYGSLAGPANLFAVGVAGGKPEQLTDLNHAVLAQRKLADFEQFSFAGSHDDNVFGYVIKPAQFKRGQNYPVAFLVHGGPQGSLANDWHWRWNAQTFAGAGYAVIMIDFHGSTGYGQSFTDSISGDWGGQPLEDLQRGLDAALKQFPWLDGSRMCALGGSYGGYLMNWIAGQWPDRFKCLVSHDGVFDHRSMYYSTEELWFPEREHGGPEYQNPAGYAKQNPVDFVSRWKTPMLVIHGALDYRVPDSQGLSMFTALQRRGVPSELLYFPNENHFVQKPADSIQWYETTLAWLDRWTHP